MDPGWVIQKDFWLEILNGPRMGVLEGFLVGNRDVGVIGERMEVWSGSQKDDITRSNGQVWAW